MTSRRSPSVASSTSSRCSRAVAADQSGLEQPDRGLGDGVVVGSQTIRSTARRRSRQRGVVDQPGLGLDRHVRLVAVPACVHGLVHMPRLGVNDRDDPVPGGAPRDPPGPFSVARFDILARHQREHPTASPARQRCSSVNPSRSRWSRTPHTARPRPATPWPVPATNWRSSRSRYVGPSRLVHAGRRHRRHHRRDRDLPGRTVPISAADGARFGRRCDGCCDERPAASHSGPSRVRRRCVLRCSPDDRRGRGLRRTPCWR